MVYGCLGTENVEKNGKIVDFPRKKSLGKFQEFHGCSERRDSIGAGMNLSSPRKFHGCSEHCDSIGAGMNSPSSRKFHDRSEHLDRMEMLRIFQVAAVFFGILMEKISRVQAAGRKIIGRRQAWYAAAGADWSCRTGYGSARNAVDAGAGTSAGASAVVAIDGRACRKRWGHARRGRKNVTDKVDVGNNPRDGNECWEHLNADKHSPASSAWSTKRGIRGCLCQWELKAPTDRSRSDYVHEQVAKRIANIRFTMGLLRCKPRNRMCMSACLQIAV